jgi:hypothetical protein
MEICLLPIPPEAEGDAKAAAESGARHEGDDDDGEAQAGDPSGDGASQ